MPAMKRKLNENDVPEPANSPSIVAPPPSSSKHEPQTFAELSLEPRLLQSVAQQRFAAPTRVQSRTIPLALAGKDVLARAKTGSGKTLAYLLPAFHSILQRKAGMNKSKATTTLVLVPTKELAAQVTNTVRDLTSHCAGEIKCENITRREDLNVRNARLAASPDLVVATPATANQCINTEALKTDQLKLLIIDEADLVLNYGYEEDLKAIAQSLPIGTQKLMMSATLRTEVDTLSALFFPQGNEGPQILDLSEEEAKEQPTLSQYTVRTAEDEKFLLVYAIFKLQLIKGKVIVFVADIDRCYRVKLFLEQFGIRSCVLNSELPINSRLHVVEEFNRGLYDIIIAVDETEFVGRGNGKKGKGRKVVELEAEQEEDEGQGQEQDEAGAEGHEGAVDADECTLPPAKKPRTLKKDREYGVSRGIDFRYVSCVLNFDLPTSSKSYAHRIGRTARAGRTGMALSFYVPAELYRKHRPTSIEQCKDDEETLAKIVKKQFDKGQEIKEWGLDWTKLEGFRYRLADALRSVTRIAIREVRTKELRNELIKSEKLKRHFEEHPDDLRHLRHDTDTHVVRQQPHLKHVPEYLLPAGGKQAVAKDIGYVGMKRDKKNGIRKRREFNKSRGKGRLAKGKKGLDPLKSLNARGMGKK